MQTLDRRGIELEAGDELAFGVVEAGLGPHQAARIGADGDEQFCGILAVMRYRVTPNMNDCGGSGAYQPAAACVISVVPAAVVQAIWLSAFAPAGASGPSKSS